MPDLSTTYMGLPLSNPIIAGSCTRTGSPQKVKALEAAGVGAVVLSSIFEEQIRVDVSDMVEALESGTSPEAYDYMRADLPMQIGPEKYLAQIRETKATVDIPVIASLNCSTHDHWIAYAKKVELAGADALELNVYDIPHDANETAADVEARHLKLVQAITAEMTIPVAVKLGPFYSSLSNFVKQLTLLDVQALVLFNRFFQPEIDIERLCLRSKMNFSRPQDIGLPTRWIALLRSQVPCDLALTTGVHDAEGAIKGLLAGANVVQVATALYQKDLTFMGDMLHDIGQWMSRKGFQRIEDFCGRLSEPVSGTPRGFARAQYVNAFLKLE